MIRWLDYSWTTPEVSMKRWDRPPAGLGRRDAAPTRHDFGRRPPVRPNIYWWLRGTLLFRFAGQA